MEITYPAPEPTLEMHHPERVADRLGESHRRNMESGLLAKRELEQLHRKLLAQSALGILSVENGWKDRTLSRCVAR